MTRAALFTFTLIVFAAGPLPAQTPPAPGTPPETQLQGEFRHEGEDLAKDCRTQPSVLHCAADLLTENPVHLAVGSLAPQNGFAAGPAFATHHPTNENWDVGWNADAVASLNGSWRAGAYVTIVRTAVPEPTVVDINAPADLAIHTYPVLDVHVQAESLQRLFFFGLGPGSRPDARASYGMSETIVGSRGVWPVAASGRLALSVSGEINGRFVSLRDPAGAQEPAVRAIYSNASAPGLSSQPGFVQFGEGLHASPTLFNNGLRLGYAVTFEQFVAPADGSQTFHRWTVDLNHEIPLTRTAVPARSGATGPDECGVPGRVRCPAPTTNRYGAINLRVLASAADAGAGHQVPFYFQPTLGGSDIDANRALTAYDDYRFRGPREFLLQESIEHYVYSVVGAMVLAEQGTVGTSSLDLSSLKSSVGVGLTLRAGNLPVASILWAHGSEGNRFVALVSTTLLGGSSRPSLR